jgi:hypothetical protein
MVIERISGGFMRMTDLENILNRKQRPWYIIDERKIGSLNKISPSSTTETMVSTSMNVNDMTTVVLQSNTSTPFDIFHENTTMQYVNNTTRLANFSISDQSTTNWTRSIIISLLAFFLLMTMVILITTIFIKKRSRRTYRLSSVSSNRKSHSSMSLVDFLRLL